MNDPKLIIATRKTLERLQRRGHLPAAQAELVLAALDELQRQKAPGGVSAGAKDNKNTSGAASATRLTRSSAKRRARETEAGPSRAQGNGSADYTDEDRTASTSSRWGEELPGPVASTLWNALEANKDAACARLVCRQWAR